jgi:hypothetical protein
MGTIAGLILIMRGSAPSTGVKTMRILRSGPFMRAAVINAPRRGFQPPETLVGERVCLFVCLFVLFEY